MFFNNKVRLINMQDVRIDIRLRHDKPVDLIDMANSLISLNNMAIERISKEHGVKDTKIVLNGVKEGCDIYQLSFVFSHLLPVMESINTFASFTDYLKKFSSINEKTVKEIKEDEDISSKNAELVKSIVKPIENNNSSSLSIELHTGDNSDVHIYNISNTDASRIRDNAELVTKLKEEAAQEEKEDKHKFEKVLILLHSTINTEKKVKDKAYCDDILEGKSVATIFENPDEKKLVLDDPYNNYFLVDIDVRRMNGVPKLYTVTKLHNIIPID